MDKYDFHFIVEIHDVSNEKSTKTSDFMIRLIQLFYRELGKYFGDDTPCFNFIDRETYFEVKYIWTDFKSEGEEKLRYSRKFFEDNYNSCKYEDYSEPECYFHLY